MEQLLIIEDDIGLNQGLSKALKADDAYIAELKKQVKNQDAIDEMQDRKSVV